MKKFIQNTLLFVMPIMLLSYSTDVLLSNKLKGSNNHAQGEFPTWNAIFDNELNSEVYIMGSSRATTQIDPRIVKDSLGMNCYNLGVEGHPFWIQHLRYKLAEYNNTAPKILIQEVDLETLNMRDGLYNPDQFLPYMLWNNTIKQSIEKIKGYNYFDYYLPLLRYYGKTDAFKILIKEFLLPNSNPINRINGYIGQPKEWNGDFDRAKKTMDSYNVKIDTSVYNLFYSYLVGLKNNNVDVILTYPPEYFESLNFVENKNELIQTYSRLSSEFNFDFIDFSNDSISHSKQYFINATHLNKKGAELYTKNLVSKITARTQNNLKP